MEGQSHHPNTTPTASSSAAPPPSAEPARSRWTPKPEQILILESIFNSGTVNPSKDDTVRIRRLLEKFGPVGDANVFYWFQNRRSRSRRRQRQLQAAATSLQPSFTTAAATTNSGRGVIPFQYFNNDNNINNNIISAAGRGCQLAPSSSSECLYGFASHEGAGAGGVFSISAITDSEHNPSLAFQPHHHPPSGGGGGGGGIITVFVNGVATQVPAGSFDVKAMFGQDLILVHSTGVPVPVSDYGFCFHGLHHGETYFLVPRMA